MPFTLSHPLAAIALRPLGLPAAAVVAGTMAPDAPMFMPGRHGYVITHSPWGIVTLDVLIAVLGVAVWFAVVRDPLVDMSPSAVRDRLPARVRVTRRDLALAPLAAALGAATHVGWDEFTHVDRWGYRHIAWLRDDHLGYAGYHWTQLGSGIVGLLGVGAWSARHVLRRPARPRPPRVPAAASRAPAAVALVAGLAAIVTGTTWLPEGVHAAALHAAVAAVAALVVGVLAVAGAWQLLARSG